MIADSNSSNWIRRHMGKTLAASDYRELEADTDGDGFPTWAEYIALTDPNGAASRVMATIAMAPDGTPVIGCSDGSGGKKTYATPRYSTVYGKVSFSDSVWLEVRDNPGLYRFFKVTVDLK